MVRELLFCTTLCAGLYSADACAQGLDRLQDPTQNPTTEKYETFVHGGGTEAKAPAIAKSHIDLRDNEVWWGYFNGNYKTSDPFDMLKTGYGTKITYACGIRLKAENDFDMGKGKTIEGIKFVIPDLKNIEDVRIWISTTLSEKLDMSDCDICVQNLDKADLVQALNSTPDNFTNEIRFNTPYTIGDEDVYVGYSFRVTQIESTYDECPLVIEDREANILAKEGALYKRYDDDPEWMDYTTSGILAMQVLFSSADMKSNAVNITDSFTDVAVKKNGTTTQPLTLSTIGKDGLSSFKYVVTTNGEVSDEQTVTLDEPITQIGGEYTYDFPLKGGDTQGVYNTTIKITEVNGAANEGLYTESAGQTIVVENAPERKVFIEDYTGTWVKGAPFGFINKMKLKEFYGDKVVVVSSHNGAKDPMYLKEHDTYAYRSGIKSVPSTVIDRTYWAIYPYLGSDMGQYLRYGYADDVDRALTQLPVASVDVEGKLSDDETTVNVEAKVKFEFTGEKDNYALFYLLTEDGMQDESWVQKNGMGFYAGKGYETYDPLFEQYVNGPEEMTGLVYDDVVVAIKGLKTGVEGSISPTIQIDEIQTGKESFDLSEYPVIQDKKQLSACVVILDTKSGKVINASKCKVKSVETGINGNKAASKAVEVVRYTPDGRQVSQPVEGVNIIRYSDGRIVKSVVR